MKKLARAVVLLAVMFAGANAQAVRQQGDSSDSETAFNAMGPQCYYINGQWFCDG